MTTSENLFTTFNGPDLDRFIACLQKVRAEGLQVDKYTQAGINQNSGNVWVWSEDWSGCVYCSLSGNVQWSYSCPECGEEYDFTTHQECEAYARSFEGTCVACCAREELESE